MGSEAFAQLGMKSRPVDPQLQSIVVHSLGILLTVSLLSVIGAESRSAGGPESLFVGVLRADGAIVPYASYAGGEWKRLPGDAAPDGIALAHRRWYYVRSDGLAPLQAGSIVRFTGSHTWYEGWGVLTDFPARLVDQSSFPIPRLGAVVSQPISAVAFQATTDDGPEILTVLRSEFERQEEEQLRSTPSFGHPQTPAARRLRPIRREAIYRTVAELGGGQVYYVILRREYSPVTKGGGTLYRPMSVLSAWLFKDAGRFNVASASLQLDSGSEMQISTAQPFAALRLDNHEYVLAEFGQYEASDRTVLELTAQMKRVLAPDH